MSEGVGTEQLSPTPPMQPPVVIVQPKGYVKKYLSPMAGLLGLSAVGIIAVWWGVDNFPAGAPVESIFAFGIIVDLIALAVTLAVLLSVGIARNNKPAVGEPEKRPSVLGIIGFSLVTVVFLCWFFGGGALSLVFLFIGLGQEGVRYMNLTGALFMLGIPWVVGSVFSAIGMRKGGNKASNWLSLTGVVFSALLIVGAVIASIAYGLKLTD